MERPVSRHPRVFGNTPPVANDFDRDKINLQRLTKIFKHWFHFQLIIKNLL